MSVGTTFTTAGVFTTSEVVVKIAKPYWKPPPGLWDPR